MSPARQLLLVVALLLPVASPRQYDAELSQFNLWFHQQGGKWSGGVTASADVPLCLVTEGDHVRRSELRVTTKGNSRIARETVSVSQQFCQPCLSLTAMAQTQQALMYVCVNDVQVIVGTPHHLLLTPSAAEVCPACNNHQRLALNLLIQQSLGNSSIWAPYIALLPAFVPSAGSFSNSDLEQLSGTYAGAVLISVRRQVARFISQVRSLRSRVGAKYSDDALRWALAIVLSRAFTVGRPANRLVSGPADTLYGVPFLAPGADLLNHSPVAQVGWTLSADAGTVAVGAARRNAISDPASSSRSPLSRDARMFAIVSLEQYNRPGMEVFNSYHDYASNAHLLAHYGFVLPQNPHDGIAITMPISTLVGDALSSLRSDLIARARSLHEQGVATAEDVEVVAAVVPHSFEASTASQRPVSSLIERNLTVMLHEAGQGPLPISLLNLARLTALSTPSILAWLDAYGTTNGAVYHRQPHNGRTSTATPSMAPGRAVAGRSAAAAAPKASVVPLKVRVVASGSAHEEVDRVQRAISARAGSDVRRVLHHLLGSERAAPLLTGLHDASTASHSSVAVASDGSAVVSDGGTREVQSVSAAYLLDGHLNTSALTDLAALRLLLSSLRTLQERYPGSITEDERSLAAAHLNLEAAVHSCGGKLPRAFNNDNRNSSAVGSGASVASRRSRAAAAAAAISEHSVVPAALQSPLTPEENARRVKLASQIQLLQRKIAILTCRISEARILSSTIAQVQQLIGKVAAELRAHGLQPLTMSSPSSSQARSMAMGATPADDSSGGWAADAPSISLPIGYQSEHVDEIGGDHSYDSDDAGSSDSGAWFGGTDDETGNGGDHGRLRSRASHSHGHSATSVTAADNSAHSHAIEHSHNDGSRHSLAAEALLSEQTKAAPSEAVSTPPPAVPRVPAVATASSAPPPVRTKAASSTGAESAANMQTTAPSHAANIRGAASEAAAEGDGDELMIEDVQPEDTPAAEPSPLTPGSPTSAAASKQNAPTRAPAPPPVAKPINRSASQSATMRGLQIEPEDDGAEVIAAEDDVVVETSAPDGAAGTEAVAPVYTSF